MPELQEDVKELHTQLEKGSITRAYRALLSYMMSLRTHFVSKYGEAAVSSLYQGYLDMTYFALFPPELKRHGLKLAIVFNYQLFGFEAWLAARNRKIQQQYRELFMGNQLPRGYAFKHSVNEDSIIEYDLVKDFDLSSLAALTEKIENGTAAFIDDIVRFLSEHQGV